MEMVLVKNWCARYHKFNIVAQKKIEMGRPRWLEGKVIIDGPMDTMKSRGSQCEMNK